MNIKPGVKLLGVKPELVVGLIVADGVWREDGEQLTVTSCVDSKHKVGSLHYKGYAADLRTRDLAPDVPMRMVTTLKARLGPDFDVVLEADHIHIEYDPKEGL